MATAASPVYDLVISAVSYDALLVGEIIAQLAPRLRSVPAWTTPSASPDGVVDAPLHETVSRVVLVLGQRLWGRDDATAADESILRDRVQRKPVSVVVASLDDEPLPDWMSSLPRANLTKVGVNGVVQFVLNAVAKAGGKVRAEFMPLTADASPMGARWPEPPTPFLGQPRAYSALRRELDALCAALEPECEPVDGDETGEHIRELHKLPHRVVARLDDVGVSFSWVPGRAGTVADGRLMVIEWSGVTTQRGVRALQAATPIRECVYSAEARGAEDWCWRAEAPNGRASTTTNLAREWMAGATMSSQAPQRLP